MSKLGVSGVAVLVGVDAVTGDSPAILPILACLGATLSYGFASVYGRKFREMGIDPVVGAFGQTAAASVLMLPLVLIFATHGGAQCRMASRGAPQWA